MSSPPVMGAPPPGTLPDELWPGGGGGAPAKSAIELIVNSIIVMIARLIL